MSDGSNQNWGKKGACLGQFLVMVFLFIILLIWVYNKNGAGLEFLTKL
jgi:hypothetical protein